MLIGIDICNTIADVKSEIEKVVGPNPTPSVYFHPMVNDMFFENNLWIFDQAQPIGGSVEALQRLSLINRLVYITSRPVEAMDITRNWFKKHGYPMAEVIITRNKPCVAKTLEIDLAIDDSPFEISGYLAANVNVWVKAQVYNQQFGNRFEWPDFIRSLARSA